MRHLVTTYFGPGKSKPVVKTTRGSRIEEVVPNISRHMTQNDYGATVASVHDDNTGQLLVTATYFIGAKLNFQFHDADTPICVTNP